MQITCPHCQKVVETQNDLLYQVIKVTRCQECKEFIGFVNGKPTKTNKARLVFGGIGMLIGIIIIFYGLLKIMGGLENFL